MATSAIPGYGTLLKMGDGATPETFSTIVEVNEINPPEITLKTDDATHHGSGGWEEVIATLLSGGEISAKVNWIPTDATHNESTGFYAAMINRTKKNWKVVLPDSTKTFAFAAYVTKSKLGTPLDKKMTAEITLKITGAVTVS